MTRRVARSESSGHDVIQHPVGLSSRELLSVARLVALGVICLPFLIPSLPANMAPADGLILVAMITLALWAGSTRERLRLPYLIPVWVIATTGVLAAIRSQFPAQGGVAVAQDVYLLFWCATVANVMRTPAAMRLVVRAWAVSSTLAAGVLVVAVLTRQWGVAGVGSGSSRAAFTFGEQNGAALYFVLSLMVALAARCPRRRILRMGVVSLMAAAVIATGSLAGLLGLGAGLATAGAIALRDRLGYPAAVATFVIFLLVGGAAVRLIDRSGLAERAQRSTNVYIRNSIGREAQSKSEREVLARETTGLYPSGGILGMGPASTKYVLEAEQAPYPKEAHNDYVAALVERGIIGLLGVLLLAGAIIVRAARVTSARHLAKEFLDIVPMPAFLAGGLVAVLVFSLTHESLHDRTVWTLLGLVAGMYAWGRERAEREVG